MTLLHFKQDVCYKFSFCHKPPKFDHRSRPYGQPLNLFHFSQALWKIWVRSDMKDKHIYCPSAI